MIDRYYLLGPYENNDRHSIVRDDPKGGDPITLITIGRLHRPDDVYKMIELANRQLEAMAFGALSEDVLQGATDAN